MPSPFPGMDPYLENPGLWPDVHHELISVARGLLNEQLRPKYHVRIEERVYLSDDSDPGREVIIPDLSLAERPGEEDRDRMAGGGAGPAVAEPIIMITLLDPEIREAYLEVVDSEGRQVVTIIELLSPTNKVPGARGQESFFKKRREVVNSRSHWVEIDLLRKGKSLDFRRRLRSHDYLVHVSKADQRPDGLVWPIRLDQPLPVIPIPLRPGDPDAPLDLQAALTIAYDRAGYDLQVDYRAEPVPPLPGHWAAWAEARLREKGLR